MAFDCLVILRAIIKPFFRIFIFKLPACIRLKMPLENSWFILAIFSHEIHIEKLISAYMCQGSMRDVFLVNPVVYKSLDLFQCAVRAWTKFESARLDPFSPTKWRHLEEISTHLPLDLASLLHKMEDFSGKSLIFVFINACRLSSQDCKSDLNAEIFEIYPFRR